MVRAILITVEKTRGLSLTGMVLCDFYMLLEQMRYFLLSPIISQPLIDWQPIASSAL